LNESVFDICCSVDGRLFQAAGAVSTSRTREFSLKCLLKAQCTLVIHRYYFSHGSVPTHLRRGEIMDYRFRSGRVRDRLRDRDKDRRSELDRRSEAITVL